MTYKSNIDSILKSLQSKVGKEAVHNMHKEIAQSIFASNLERIHNKGKGEKESSIGKYHPSTKKYRIRKNRQVAYVDLEVSGKLRTSWKLLEKGDGYVIGFGDKYGADISEYMEKHFKKKIWGISPTDKEVANRIVKRYLAA